MQFQAFLHCEKVLEVFGKKVHVNKQPGMSLICQIVYWPILKHTYPEPLS